jgi:ATP-dependent RNA helicase DeaD
MTFPTTHPALAGALAARDYSVPTAVQLAVLAPEAAKRDLLVSAQTGSGKTVAFGLAMAATLLGDAEKFERAAEPLALIIAPTRELAMQVHRELEWLYADTNARVITCVGGMEPRAEVRQLKIGAHIVVGTPGRLRDHIERKRLDLAWIKTIVLDEADEMLDLGFREDLEFILDATPEHRQTLLFSATMPREIETLARRYQRDSIRIETSRRNEQHADIEYQAIRVASHDIENAVVNVLRFHETRATLVFCATREAVKRMQARLLDRGFAAVALSGELTQTERTSALQSLRDGRARVLVATDVAARGLDLPDLALVIHADLPNDGETLLHRSGRTGRAGRKGMCILIVPFNKRRKAETLLSAAKLTVTWAPAPTADEIRGRDQERFLADAVFTEPPTEDDLAGARTLQAARTADEIAIALVRMQRARLPAPEDLAEDAGPPRRENGTRFGADRFERPAENVRGFRARSAPAGAPEQREQREPRRERTERPDGRQWTWFQLNIGRERNADPRWLLPLICRAGDVTKSEIGLIKIDDRDTRFQILAEFAEKFAETVRTNKTKEGHISRVGDNSPPPVESAAPEAVTEVAKPVYVAKGDHAKPRPQREAAHRDAPPRDGAARGFVARDKAPRDHAARGPSTGAAGKPPWKDRGKPKTGGYVARTSSPPGKNPHTTPKRPETAGAPKSASKYAFKKKHRATTAGGR